MSQSKIPDSLRLLIVDQFKFCCAYCQTQQHISGVRLAVDYIIPESLGGDKWVCIINYLNSEGPPSPPNLGGTGLRSPKFGGRGAFTSELNSLLVFCN
jgi:hypothetical protein